MPSNGHTYANVVRFTLASYGIAVRGKRNEIGGGSEPARTKFDDIDKVLKREL